ncbi:MAG: hypothetical protein R3E31_13440 [Chloroflexota bacterium]|nr:hypothetical protein [Anaerolineales bacterium]MCB8968409.1 hypothetical protein [Ardenticatenaceae bacterium]
MIQVGGTTKLSFMFPANRDIAYAYYLDMERVVRSLSHIEFISAGPNGSYRLAYNTIELGAYHIRIICDVQAEIDETGQLLRFLPVEQAPQISPKSGFNSATTRGYYYSASRFFDEGEQTRIEYQLDLKAELPTPIALRVVPEKVLNKISYNITTWRIKEIAGGFIEDSIARFPQWQQEHGT